MIRTEQSLSEKEKKDYIVFRSAQGDMWIGLVLTGFSAYLSYLLIRLIYDEIRTTRYNIQDVEIIDLSLLVLFFIMLLLLITLNK